MKFFDIIKFESKKWVDAIIKSFFFSTIIASTFYAAYKIFCEILEVNKDANKLKILEIAENIFLYLIPIFILLGFYNYYKFDLRPKLLDKGLPRGVDKKAITDSIYLTKSLFLSSIISFVIIKSIEKIYFYSNDSKPELKSLISYGIFLIILMVYAIYVHKSHKHKD
ncbi:hypothetical protein EZY14_001880 [Kordia sp. TARA_039_SRF]|nr:hypothetical protein EZY14_001880 [Kordia sp. TARA_039_SRF]